MEILTSGSRPKLASLPVMLVESQVQAFSAANPTAIFAAQLKTSGEEQERFMTISTGAINTVQVNLNKSMQNCSKQTIVWKILLDRTLDSYSCY